jgi:hypothetical protein
MGQPPKPVVGSWVRTEQFAEHLTDLSQHVAVDALKVDAPASSAPVALVLELDEADEETFKVLCRIRHVHARTPVIALARTLDANLAVELIKLGVTDCVCLPAPPPVLWRKVERAVLRSGGPTLDSPLIALLWDADEYPAHEEKRRCFRSETVADYPAYVTVVRPTTLPKMLVKNLSILTEGCPGGFALVGANVHVHALKVGEPFRFVLAVPEFPRPIPGQAILTRLVHQPRPGDPSATLGVEYRIDDAAHEVPVRRFWSESQRRVAAIKRSAAGAIE